MYLAVYTRSDIAFIIRKLSQYIINLYAHYLYTVKRPFRYIRKTKDIKIQFSAEPEFKSELSKLRGYFDTNYGGNKSDRKSIYEHIF